MSFVSGGGAVVSPAEGEAAEDTVVRRSSVGGIAIESSSAADRNQQNSQHAHTQAFEAFLPLVEVVSVCA